MWNDQIIIYLVVKFTKLKVNSKNVKKKNLIVTQIAMNVQWMCN